MRVIRALHELGIEAIAVYSTADSRRCTSRSRTARSASARPPLQSYLRIPNVIRGADDRLRRRSPRLRVPCREPGVRAGVRGVGSRLRRPSAGGDGAHGRQGACEGGDACCRSAARPGDKTRSRAFMSCAWRRASSGFPVLVKAAAGGGGKGMRLVKAEDDLESAYASADAERAAFGDGALYLEKAVVPARFVEVQVLCDGAGGITLGEREYSISGDTRSSSRSHRPPRSPPTRGRRWRVPSNRHCCDRIRQRRDVRVPARAGRRIPLHRSELPAPGRASRLRLVTGIDIVREQVRIASGERLEVTGRTSRRGHAIEIRINAEDPARGFAPAPGIVTGFRPPLGAGCASTPQFGQGRIRRTTTR